MRRKVIVSIVLILLLVGAGGGAMQMLILAKRQPERATPQQHALLVETTRVEPQTVVEPILGYGTARADREARITSQVMGEVVELADGLKPGAAFRRADVLLQIDDREYREILAQAEAGLKAERERLAQLDVQKTNLESIIAIVERQFEIQEAEFKKVEALRKQDFAHTREYDQQRLALETLRARLQDQRNALALIPTQRESLQASCDRLAAQVQIARLSVERCTITAPFDGRLDQLMVELGERVVVGAPLLTLLDPDLMEVPIELPASLRSRVGVGASCELAFESDEANCWKGRVSRIAPSANPLTRTFALYVEVNNRGQTHPLIPGMFVRATIDGPTLENVLLVPRGAIQDDQVFLYREGKAIARPVQIERHLRERTVVRGLDPGSVVITSNLDVLRDGTPVRPGDEGLAAALPTPRDPGSRLLADPK